MKKRFVILSIVLTVTVWLAGCGAATPAAPRPPLMLSWTVWPGYYPLAIAQQQGVFCQARRLGEDRRIRRLHDGLHGLCFRQIGWE